MITTQQATQQYTESRLRHALEQHALALGFDPSGLDWPAILAALIRLLAAGKTAAPTLP